MAENFLIVGQCIRRCFDGIVGILKNIIQLANDLEITTVMEGVESADQVEFMRSMKCDIVQGYYYDKPLSTTEFEEKYFRQ